MKTLTVEIANQINDLVSKIQPNTKKELSDLLNKENVKYKIIDVLYFGYLQGVKIILTGNNKKYIRPKKLVWSIFK